MGKKIVIALGGNALGNNLPEQMAAVKETAKAIADLIEEGHEVVISHGNGPQVGMINLAMGELAKADPDNPVAPLSVCVAMSQGYIGYDLQNALREELLNRGINKPVSSIITQMRVDPDDEAFKNPTKPIGRFMTREEADEMIRDRGYDVMEDAGRGYRRVVASPKPVEIVEIETVRSLINDGQVVIAAGGGGIPVYAQGNHLKGAAAVVDKDFGSSLLAREIDADWLIILTAVENVAVNYGKPNQENLSELTPEQAQVYIEEGQFAPGSMLPKVEAAVEFAQSGEGRQSLITLLEKARDGINGKTGTVIHNSKN
jgi:carbamate kinase